MRVQYDVMKETIKKILIGKGLEVKKAEKAAIIFTDNSCDGVYSHGLNRFPRVLSNIEEGIIDLKAEPRIVNQVGALEVIDGGLGLGVLNADFCMERAVSLSKTHGIGCVSIRNNNHWMRGATYGLKATKAGVIGICFTNTCPNMPAWGAKDSRLGNNPLIIAVPDGERGIVLDMAMSQFSYGKMTDLGNKNQMLSEYGGYDRKGNLSVDPKEILQTSRVLPVGFWKGSGLSLVLDLMATILSSGESTKKIGEKEKEYGISQVFIAINPEKTNNRENIVSSIRETIEFVKMSDPIKKEEAIYYPSERSRIRRADNLENGIPVDVNIWQQLVAEKNYR